MIVQQSYGLGVEAVKETFSPGTACRAVKDLGGWSLIFLFFFLNEGLPLSLPGIEVLEGRELGPMYWAVCTTFCSPLRSDAEHIAIPSKR